METTTESKVAINKLGEITPPPDSPPQPRPQSPDPDPSPDSPPSGYDPDDAGIGHRNILSIPASDYTDRFRLTTTTDIAVVA